LEFDKKRCMAINNAKHIIGEIDGVRCTIIETGASAQRTAFLTDLLSYNNLEVKILREELKDPAAEPTFTTLKQPPSQPSPRGEGAASISPLGETGKGVDGELQSITGRKDPAAEPTFTIGVADVVFNHVFAIYERRLKTPDGDFVTPAYWRQECMECDPRYWLRKKA
jgi:hypothetical protein